jgi:hypothetical protein
MKLRTGPGDFWWTGGMRISFSQNDDLKLRGIP